MIINEQIKLNEVVSGEYYKNCEFLPTTDVLQFSDTIFENCSFLQIEFNDSEWLDCQFIGLNLANTFFDHSTFYRCKFKQCQLTGTSFGSNRWMQVTVEEGKADYMSLNGSTIGTCNFYETSLKGSLFQEVSIKGEVTFDKCVLNETDFLNTRLKNVDFSTSVFDVLAISPSDIKGCIISPFQAVQMIELLGVKIKDS